MRTISKYTSKTFILFGLIFAYFTIVLIAMLVPSHVVSAAGNIFYVAATGNDITGNGSLTTPWATPQKAANMMVAGDTCYIETGTYGYFAVMTSGSPGNYETFENYNGEVVNINGGTGYDNIWTHAQNYIQFIGLRCVGTTTVGIDVDGNNITVQNCYFSNCTSSGIDVGTVSNTIINGCECSGTNTQGTNECLSLYGANNFVVENCKVHDPIGTGRIGIDAKDGCSNGSIHNNQVYDCGSVGIYCDGYGHPSSNINVYDNMVYNCASAGLAVNSENSPAAQTNINFYNNLVYNNGEGFVVWASPDFAKTFTIINNTFYNNGNMVEIGLYGSALDNSGCVIRNNIIVNSNASTVLLYYPAWSNDNGAYVSIDHNLFYDTNGYNANTFGSYFIQGNPLLSNPTTDFSLQIGSPAIGAGSATGAPSTDYVGTTRPQTQGYDIGAYEYVVSSAPIESIAINAILVTSIVLLPPASASYRGVIAEVQGVNGVTDSLYVCLKSAANTYSWVSIATGG